MGVNPIHDHGEARGGPRNPMGLSHEECKQNRATLGEPRPESQHRTSDQSHEFIRAFVVARLLR